MKRLLPILLAAVLVLSAMPLLHASAETYVPTRTINLVFDDSGSMIRTDGNYVDTWCQAKYAMEVFAAMLGEQDTLNIYYMSDYVSDTSAAAPPPPKISLHGSRDASTTTANVAEIHNLVTNASDTPFNSVKKAYADLEQVTSDEKWLVVLTDGEFNGTQNSRVENYFHECVADGVTKTIMFSMGPNAAEISADEANNIFFYKAGNNTEIPAKLTSACNRIFQNNALPFDAASLTSSFSVPMSELIVFAQGKEVSIDSITSEEGQTIKPNSNVKVMYSTDATTDTQYSKSKVQIADNLMGYVASFNTDFAPGTYTFNVQGAESLEIYYKPNISIAAYLYDGDNNEVTQEEKIIAGKYRLEFGFLNGVTGEPVTDTSLLGDIQYYATINNTGADGTVNEIEASSGDTVTIQQGTLDINVTAHFLKYNTVRTMLSYNVFSHNALLFRFDEKPVYQLETSGFKNGDTPMLLHVEIDNGDGPRPLRPEELELLGIPEITTKSDLDPFRVEPGDAPGTFKVFPKLKNNSPFETSGGTKDIAVKASFVQGDSSAEGSTKDNFEVTDGITAMDRLKDWLSRNGLKLGIGLLIFLLILGYVPGVKKYLPRKLKKRPAVENRAERIGLKDLPDGHGAFKKNFVSTLIPYKAQTGRASFKADGKRVGIELRAAGGNRMYVTNVKAFAGKPEYTFNGVAMEQNRRKPLSISSGTPISRRTPNYTCTCYLNR